MEKIRAFVSIDIPQEVKKEIFKIQEKIPFFKGKFTKIENLHLTLKFLGELEERKIEEIKEKLREIDFKKFKIKTDFIGLFDNRKSKSHERKYQGGLIIWLHLINCEKLQKLVDEKLSGLGFQKEKRFMSHLTIARAKEIFEKKEDFLNEIQKIEIPEMSFEANEFKLKSSTLTENGSVYETLETFYLN